MNALWVAPALLVGFILGAAFVWVILQAKRGAIAERLSAQQDVVEALQHRETQLQLELSNLRTANTRLETEKIALEVTLLEERKQTAEKLALIQQAEHKLKDAFNALAAEALKSNNQQFLDLAKSAFHTEQETAKGELKQREEAIGAMVMPVKDALTKFETKIQEIEVARQGAYSELRTQVQSLQQTGQQLQKEAANLAGALKSSNVAGDWGQMQLRQVMKMAGMIDHCDFDEQFSGTCQEGRLRPDVVVNLPGNRRIAVDAKVPLSALLEAANASDDEVRRECLVDYSRNLLKHINDLGKKEYWKMFDESPDFVVLFLPGETFFYAAQQQEQELIKMAWDQRVIVATPSTLIALLRAVALYWQQEKLAESALEVSQLGKKLYEALAGLSQAFQLLGSNLKSSVNCYNDAVSRLENSVFFSARRFSELGAAPSTKVLQELEPLELDVREIRRQELLLATANGQSSAESHS